MLRQANLWLRNPISYGIVGKKWQPRDALTRLIYSLDRKKVFFVTKRLACILLVLAMILGLAAPVAMAGTPTTYTNLTSNASKLYVRAGPSTGYKVVTYVSNNEEIDLLKVGSVWTRISVCRNGLTGYIMNRYIEELPGESQPIRRGEASAGRITGRGVNLRRGPGTKYMALGNKSYGSKLVIWGSRGNWYYVTMLSGQSGWVSKTYVSKTYTTSTTTGVNMREDPNGAIIKTLAKGTSVTVYTVDGAWSFVKQGGTHGWVYSQYLRQ